MENLKILNVPNYPQNQSDLEGKTRPAQTTKLSELEQQQKWQIQERVDKLYNGIKMTRNCKG